MLDEIFLKMISNIMLITNYIWILFFSQHFGKTNASGNPLNLIFILSEDFFKRVRKFAWLEYESFSDILRQMVEVWYRKWRAFLVENYGKVPSLWQGIEKKTKYQPRMDIETYKHF